MKSIRKQKVLELKEKCKSLAVYGVICRNKINETSGRERWDAWEEKRAIGTQTRIHYIAYGLIRGREYSTIEPKINDHNDPCALPYRARAVAGILQQYCIEGERGLWTTEYVEKLLRGETPTKVRSNG